VTREYELTVAVETSASHAKSFASAMVVGFSRESKPFIDSKVSRPVGSLEPRSRLQYTADLRQFRSPPWPGSLSRAGHS
jgi:hypothetical protein